MNNPVIPFAIAGTAVTAFIFGWLISASYIGNDCIKLGSFYLSNTVFECKVKENT